jgi:diamine N-acetyltransferase
MQLTVKPANAADAAMLAHLGATTFYDTFRAYNSEEDMQAYIQKAYDITVIEQHLNNPLIHYALVYDQTKPIGYLKLLLDVKHEKLTGKLLELEKIYVQSALGSGAGKFLMEYAIAFGKQLHHDSLFLGVWEENKRAVRFYEKMGFNTFAHRSFTLGSRVCDDYMMVLNLNLGA